MTEPSTSTNTAAVSLPFLPQSSMRRAGRVAHLAVAVRFAVAKFAVICISIQRHEHAPALSSQTVVGEIAEIHRAVVAPPPPILAAGRVRREHVHDVCVHGRGAALLGRRGLALRPAVGLAGDRAGDEKLVSSGRRQKSAKVALMSKCGVMSRLCQW